MFRPQPFSCSRRFIPFHTLRIYFIPLPRLRFPFQGFSPKISRLDLSPNRTLSILTSLSCRKSFLNCPGFRHFILRVFPISGPLPLSDFSRLPAPDPLLSFHPFGIFFKYLENAFTFSPFLTFSTKLSCDPSSWPSTYQSVSNLFTYL
jgi:hypothetical protein